MKSQAGFTLVEVLVVTSLLVTLAAVSFSLFWGVLRGSTKSKMVILVKQNGDYALNVMERMIRNARQIKKNSDGQVCQTSMTKIKIQNPDGGETEFGCEGDFISSNSARLTSSQVEVSNCFFDCLSGGGIKPDVVTIHFTLSVGEETARPEEKATVDFHTTVGLRNVY